MNEPPHIFSEEMNADQEESGRPSLLTMLILLILIAAMLTTLLWPLLPHRSRPDPPRPTPTPLFLIEA